jgi:hypothetical protein
MTPEREQGERSALQRQACSGRLPAGQAEERASHFVEEIMAPKVVLETGSREAEVIEKVYLAAVMAGGRWANRSK